MQQVADARDYVQRGNGARAEGRLEEAVAAYRSALALEPAYAEAHNNLGELLAAAGDSVEAEHSFNEAISIQSGYAEAYNNLGKLLQQRGLYSLATAEFRRAVGENPAFVEANILLAGCLAREGNTQEAATYLLKAVRAAPANLDVLAHYVEFVRDVEFTRVDAEQVELLHECFHRPNVDLQDIVDAAVSLIKLDPRYTALVKLLEDDSYGRINWLDVRSTVSELFEHPLVADVLAESYVTDLQFERLVRVIRRLALLNSEQLVSADLSLLSLLALQSWNTEYVYSVSPAEEAKLASIEGLVEEIARSSAQFVSPAAQLSLAVCAMYVPLSDLDQAPELAMLLGRGVMPALWPVVRQTLIEPTAERARRQALQAGSTPVVPVAGVREQYEFNPFPRWLSTRALSPMTLGQFLRLQFPGFDPPAFYEQPSSILIAGCGTGKQAIDVALRHPDAAVTAIDWSLASLAYAERMADRLRVRNVDFKRLDINDAKSLARQFDYIECSGVLHCMPDPEQAWQLLSGLVRPGGVMNIGLYSAPARTSIARLRERNQSLGISGTRSEIRTFRDEVISGDLTWVREELAEWRDFFTMSGMRDLIFAAHEDCFDIPRIARTLDLCQLDFVGFAFRTRDVPTRYAQLFPGDTSLTDLALWHQYEMMFPMTFTAMYQIYCQKR